MHETCFYFHIYQTIKLNLQEPDKSAEPNNDLNQVPSVSTGSTSYAAKPTRKEDSPFFSISPVASPQYKLSPRNKVHPNASNLPPLPNSKARNTSHNKDNDSKYRLSQVNRSASTREFRKLDQRKNSKLYAVED